jgi:hypothetical protein
MHVHKTQNNIYSIFIKQAFICSLLGLQKTSNALLMTADGGSFALINISADFFYKQATILK